MDAALDALRIVNLIAAGIVAGAQAFGLVAIVRSLPEYEPRASAFLHQHSLTDRPHHFLRVVGLVAIVTAAALVVLLVVDDQWTVLVLTAVGLALAVISTAISTREWPINEEIKSWGAAPKLDRYAELRRIWDERHVKRTWLSVAALALFAVAVALADGA